MVAILFKISNIEQGISNDEVRYRFALTGFLYEKGKLLPSKFDIPCFAVLYSLL